jgi:hypothetical protein
MAPELRSALEESAKAGSRSLHAEIVARLQSSFVAHPTRTKDWDEIRAKLERLLSDAEKIIASPEAPD